MASLEERARLLLGAQNDTQAQAVLMELCRRDIVFWFENFCWTFDPRQSPPHLPFNLYPFQRQFVRDLSAQIDEGRDVLVEKSRDMGISWLVLLVFQYYWLFRPGSNFLLGSRKEEYVDKKGDPSTLFEKLRFNLSWMPPWMKPKGWDDKLHSPFMRLINPGSGNIITGESTNANFARGGRYKAILFDEFPFWDLQDLAFPSAEAASPCRVIVGTPYGKSNRFARIRFEGNTRVLRLHWRDHPLKDEAWYEAIKKRLSKDELAREHDISYEHSVEGIVFGDFTDSHVVKEAYQFDPFKRTIVAFDFGRTMSAILAQKDEYERLHVFKELVIDPAAKYGLKGENTADLGRMVKSYLADLTIKSPISYVCDPAGNNPDHRTKTTDVQTLEAMGLGPLEFKKAHAMRDRLKEGVSLTKKKLSERIAGGESILVYEPGCPILLEAFRSGYRYQQDHTGNITDKIQQEHPYEDVMDCLRYILIEKFTVSEPPKVPKRQAGRGNRYTGY